MRPLLRISSALDTTIIPGTLEAVLSFSSGRSLPSISGMQELYEGTILFRGERAFTRWNFLHSMKNLNVTIKHGKRTLADDDYELEMGKHTLYDDEIAVTYRDDLTIVRMNFPSVGISIADPQYVNIIEAPPKQAPPPKPRYVSVPPSPVKPVEKPAVKPMVQPIEWPTARQPERPKPRPAAYPTTDELRKIAYEHHKMDRTDIPEPAPRKRPEYKATLAENMSYTITALKEIAKRLDPDAPSKLEEQVASQFNGQRLSESFRINGTIAYKMVSAALQDKKDIGLLPANPEMPLLYSEARRISTLHNKSSKFDAWIAKNPEALIVKEEEGKKVQYIDARALNDFLA